MMAYGVSEHRHSLLLQPAIEMNTTATAGSFWLNHICMAFDLFSLSLLRRWKKNHRISVTVFQSDQLFDAKVWNPSGEGMTLSVCLLHLVCMSGSIRAGWLFRRGLRGHCVWAERCTEWITFTGNSCQIHQSRAKDRKAGRKTDRGGWQRQWAWPDCLPSSNTGLKGFWWVATPGLLTGVSGPRQLIV